jgi:hypothetical protein
VFATTQNEGFPGPVPLHRVQRKSKKTRIGLQEIGVLRVDKATTGIQEEGKADRILSHYNDKTLAARRAGVRVL